MGIIRKQAWIMWMLASINNAGCSFGSDDSGLFKVALMRCVFATESRDARYNSHARSTISP